MGLVELGPAQVGVVELGPAQVGIAEVRSPLRMILRPLFRIKKTVAPSLHPFPVLYQDMWKVFCRWDPPLGMRALLRLLPLCFLRLRLPHGNWRHSRRDHQNERYQPSHAHAIPLA